MRFLMDAGRTRFIALVLLLAYLPACHSWRTETVTPQAVIEAKHPDQIRVARADGTKQVLHQPAVVGDTLRGTAREPAIPLSDVQAVETRHGDTGKTLLLGLGIAVGVVAAAAIACAATDCLDLHFGSFGRAAAMR
jgi:hypothetical protein